MGTRPSNSSLDEPGGAGTRGRSLAVSITDGGTDAPAELVRRLGDALAEAGTVLGALALGSGGRALAQGPGAGPLGGGGASVAAGEEVDTGGGAGGSQPAPARTIRMKAARACGEEERRTSPGYVEAARPRQPASTESRRRDIRGS